MCVLCPSRGVMVVFQGSTYGGTWAGWNRKWSRRRICEQGLIPGLVAQWQSRCSWGHYLGGFVACSGSWQVWARDMSGFFIMSAGLWYDSICYIRMNWCLCDFCRWWGTYVFLFPFFPRFVAILIVALLYMRNGMSLPWLAGSRSAIFLCIQSFFWSSCKVARYSSSHVLSAIVFCLFKCHAFGAPKLERTANFWLYGEDKLVKSKSEYVVMWLV